MLRREADGAHRRRPAAVGRFAGSPSAADVVVDVAAQYGGRGERRAAGDRRARREFALSGLGIGVEPMEVLMAGDEEGRV